jgi:hypothetical protein
MQCPPRPRSRSRHRVSEVGKHDDKDDDERDGGRSGCFVERFEFVTAVEFVERQPLARKQNPTEFSDTLLILLFLWGRRGGNRLALGDAQGNPSVK